MIFYKYKMMRWIIILFLLTGCSDPITFKSITLMKSALDGTLTINGEKNTTDIGVSAVTGYDCMTARALKEEDIKFYCVDVLPENLTKELK